MITYSATLDVPTDCPAPGVMESLIRRKDESHGGTEEVP
jgi:hypothetical protein